MHRESNLLIVQQDVTVFSLLYFCRWLYMFCVLTPIIRSSCNCNYSFWHGSAGSTTIRSRWVGTDSYLLYSRYTYRTIHMNQSQLNNEGGWQQTRLTSARSCNYSCTSSCWWVSTPETCRAAYRNVINWIQSHFVGKLVNFTTVFFNSCSMNDLWVINMHTFRSPSDISD